MIIESYQLFSKNKQVLLVKHNLSLIYIAVFYEFVKKQLNKPTVQIEFIFHTEHAKTMH